MSSVYWIVGVYGTLLGICVVVQYTSKYFGRRVRRGTSVRPEGEVPPMQEMSSDDSLRMEN